MVFSFVNKGCKIQRLARTTQEMLLRHEIRHEDTRTRRITKCFVIATKTKTQGQIRHQDTKTQRITKKFLKNKNYTIVRIKIPGKTL